MWNAKRPNNFEDAYRILDDALAAESSPHLGPLIKNEMRIFKALAADETREVGVMVNDLRALGIGHASQIARAIEADIREKPALYLGVAALGAIAFGILMVPSSQSQSQSQSHRASGGKRQIPRRKTTHIRGATK